jgi:hypothetical protein
MMAQLSGMEVFENVKHGFPELKERFVFSGSPSTSSSISPGCSATRRGVSPMLGCAFEIS